MLSIIDKNSIGGDLPASDCENMRFVWLSDSGTCSFYIGDDDNIKQKIHEFLSGSKLCYIDKNTYFDYLNQIDEIVRKYKYLFRDPINIKSLKEHFDSLSNDECSIKITYTYPDRYLKTSKRDDNVVEFKSTLIPNITYVKIKKSSNRYTIFVSLVEDWREKIMMESGAKVTLDAIRKIFLEEINSSIKEGLDKEKSAQVFAIKYAPLLNANKHKFNYSDLVKNTSFDKDSIIDAIKNGVALSPFVIWEKGSFIDFDNAEEEYKKFFSLIEWFINQLNINNKVVDGIATSGQGYRGDAIRDKYSKWREYEHFTLDCNMVTGMHVKSPKLNYINVTETGINIRPHFDKNSAVDELYFDLYDTDYDNSNEEIQEILSKQYSVDNLDLDLKEPNQASKQLFDDYKKLIELVNINIIDDIEKENSVFDYTTTPGEGINKIFFGTPGCGKSYHIEYNILGKDKETKKYGGTYNENNIIRTTFYQDYSNTDFVGQILPKIEKDTVTGKGTVEYIFNPGPFTLAFIQAVSNPKEKVALVIEEINRGNAPAIFGDIFQLLDRDEKGISEYGIKNVNLIDYLNDYTFTVNGEKTHYKFKEIRIPGNLNIYATMNTSDQNVYTLDTAFTRRWYKERIPNPINDEIGKKHVPGMKEYSWKEFVCGINECLSNNLDNLQIDEDKQVGMYFIPESMLIADKNTDATSKEVERFSYKIFDYLWNDVSKLDHGVLFKNYNTLQDLITSYQKDGVKVFKSNIFELKGDQPLQEDEQDEQ